MVVLVFVFTLAIFMVVVATFFAGSADRYEERQQRNRIECARFAYDGDLWAACMAR